MSKNTYSVCFPQGSNRNTPSPFNFKHSCKHLLVSHLCICVGKYHPFMLALCTDKTSASYLWTVISSVAMRHISSQDEELEEMKSRLSDSLGGKPVVKEKPSGEKCAVLSNKSYIHPGGPRRPIQTEVSD